MKNIIEKQETKKADSRVATSFFNDVLFDSPDTFRKSPSDDD
mgnify:CR=1 FL=1